MDTKSLWFIYVSQFNIQYVYIYIYNLMMLRYAKQSHVWSDFDPSGPFREIPSADDPQR